MNNGPDLVGANTNSPALVGNDIVDTFAARVAGRLQCIARKGTRCGRSIAGTDINGVCGVAEMIRTGVLAGLRGVGI